MSGSASADLVQRAKAGSSQAMNQAIALIAAGLAALAIGFALDRAQRRR